MRSSFIIIVLLSVLVLTSCAAPATPDSAIIILRKGLADRTIPTEFPYDNCTATSPTGINLSYGEVLRDSFDQDLVLGTSGIPASGIPPVVKEAIKQEIMAQFAYEKEMPLKTSQAASFDVPAFTREKVTIYLKETLREGEVSYSYAGQTWTTGYTYRIRLEYADLKRESVLCPTPSPTESNSTFTPEPTLIPSPIPTPYPCGSKFDAAVWTPVTTDNLVFPIHDGGHCWQLTDFGMTMSNGAISILKDEGPTKASWYGVIHPVPANFQIHLDVCWNELTDGQIWIGFVESQDMVVEGKFLVIKRAAPNITKHISAFSVEGRDGNTLFGVFDNVFVEFDNKKYTVDIQVDANRMKLWLNNNPAPSFPVLGVYPRYLFIGYLANYGIDIDATISNIQIK